MKRLVIHAGMHKTGTSYLQLWLHANRAALSAQGVLYPEFGMKFPNANHHTLADELLQGDDPAPMADKLAAVAGQHETVLLSSETLSSLFSTSRQDAARAFADAFGRHFEITVVVYLRRQDETAESAHAEIAKTRTVLDMEEALGRNMNWYGRMGVMEGIFGEGHVRPRPFFRPAWPDGSLANDLLAAAGVGPLAGAVDVERTNESMPRRKTLFLGPLAKDRIVNLSRFIEQVRASNAIADDGIRWLMSPQQRRTLLAQYERTNGQLCRQYFAGAWTEYFNALPDDDADWFAPEPITADEGIGFAIEAWTRAMSAESQADGLRRAIA